MSDIIYYDINIASPTGLSVKAEYSETRVQNILDDPSDYYVAISRFSIDASAIPIFVCPVIPNPLNPLDFNYTPYKITISYNNGITNDVATVNLRYIPVIQTLPIPLPPVAGQQDLTSFYYYVYYYQTFIQMTNNAINDALAQIQVLNPGLLGIKTPYFQYNSDTNSVDLIVPNDPLYITAYNTLFGQQYTPVQYPDAGSVGKIIIYLDSALYKYYSLINSYSAIIPLSSPPDYAHLMIVTDNKNNYYYPPQNQANTIANQTPISFTESPPVVIPTFPATASVTFTTDPLWLIFQQEANAISTWNSLSSLVFLTQTIPVQPEYVPYASVASLQKGGNIGAASFLPILTDFVPDLTTAKDSRVQFTYYANPYRLVQLNSNVAMRRIDLQIFWEDKFQNLYPLFVSGNALNSIKLVFIKKSLANYNYRSIMYN